MKYKNISNEKIRVSSNEGLVVVNPKDSFESEEHINNNKLEIINEKVTTKKPKKVKIEKPEKEKIEEDE